MYSSYTEHVAAKAEWLFPFWWYQILQNNPRVIVILISISWGSVRKTRKQSEMDKNEDTPAFKSLQGCAPKNSDKPTRQNKKQQMY